MISRKTKVSLYVNIMRPTYGCEVWTMTKQTERNLRTLENRVWRKICGPIFWWNNGDWQKRQIRELYDMLKLAPTTSFIKGQRLQWLGHTMWRGENEAVRLASEWKPQGKRLRERPRKIWIDVVKGDKKTLRIENWREAVENRDRWWNVVMAAKTFRE